jgi:hypothetical protein
MKNINIPAFLFAQFAARPDAKPEPGIHHNIVSPIVDHPSVWVSLRIEYGQSCFLFFLDEKGAKEALSCYGAVVNVIAGKPSTDEKGMHVDSDGIVLTILLSNKGNLRCFEYPSEPLTIFTDIFVQLEVAKTLPDPS